MRLEGHDGYCVESLRGGVSIPYGMGNAKDLAYFYSSWHLLLTLPKRVMRWRRQRTAKDFWIQDTCTSYGALQIPGWHQVLSVFVHLEPYSRCEPRPRRPLIWSRDGLHSRLLLSDFIPIGFSPSRLFVESLSLILSARLLGFANLTLVCGSFLPCCWRRPTYTSLILQHI